MGLVSCCWLLSAVLGFVALTRAKKFGHHESLGKYWILAGFHSFFSALSVLGLFVTAFFYAKFQAVDKQQMREEAASIRAKFGEGQAYDVEMAKRIGKRFQWQLNEIRKKYQLAGAALTNPVILDMAGITDVGEIGNRIETIQDFIIASRELRDFSKNSTAIYKYEVSRHVLSETARQEVLKGFLDRTEKLNPTIITMRDAELHKCDAMLKLLKLLEKTWGQWEWDSVKGGVIFDTDAQTKNYAALVAKIEAAETRMNELQDKLASLQQATK